MKSSKPQGRSTGNPSSRKASVSRTRAGNGNLSSRIAVAAYFKAQARGFAPGHELDDWLIAEQEVRT